MFTGLHMYLQLRWFWIIHHQDAEPSGTGSAPLSRLVRGRILTQANIPADRRCLLGLSTHKFGFVLVGGMIVIATQ